MIGHDLLCCLAAATGAVISIILMVSDYMYTKGYHAGYERAKQIAVRQHEEYAGAAPPLIFPQLWG